MFFVHRASVKPILVSPLKAVDYLCFIYLLIPFAAILFDWPTPSL